MANVCMLLGKSGTGKSTSVKTLDPKETVVINVLKKRLPFKGSNSLYNKENRNLFEIDDHTQAVALLTSIDKQAPHVKKILIDDMIYIMRKEYFKRAKETGYGKYTELAQHFQQIISTCEGMRDNINIFFIVQYFDFKRISRNFAITKFSPFNKSQITNFRIFS